MIKKNILLVSITLLFLLAVIFLFQSNRNLKNELLSVNQKKEVELKKTVQYDSMTTLLREIILDFSHESNESSTGIELINDVTLILKQLKNENDLSKNYHVNTQNEKDSDASKMQFSESNFASLKFVNDSIKSLLEKSEFINDSLNSKLKLISKSLENSKKDSTSIISSKNVQIFYFGNMLKKKANGFGVGFYKGKGYYIGNWLNNTRNGHGKHSYLNGDMYDGNFYNDSREGFGIYNYTTGDKYEGEWKNDLMNGKGKIILKNGTIKEGFWIDGKMK